MSGDYESSGPFGGCVVFFVGLMFVVAILITWADRQKTIEQARESTDWPTAVSQVVSSEVIGTGYAGAIDLPPSTTWEAAVHVTFPVRDNTYITSTLRFRFDGDYSNPEGYDKAQAMLREYPVGEIVTVYYDPENPQTIVQEPVRYPGRFPLAAICIGVFGLVIAVGGLVIMAKS